VRPSGRVALVRRRFSIGCSARRCFQWPEIEP